MKRLIAACIFLGMSFSPSFAEWTIDEMNNHIDATNWIVDVGCSGTTIDKKRKFILTNWHCVNGTLGRKNGGNMRDGDIPVSQQKYQDYSVVKRVTYMAEVVAVNRAIDLAVLRIRDNDLVLTVQAKLSDSDAKRGQKVYLVGNPAGEDSSVIIGNVSATARMRTIENDTRPYFQVSGGVVPGASGGSVYDENGNLIGVMGATLNNAVIIGYAIPLTIVKAFLQSTNTYPVSEP